MLSLLQSMSEKQTNIFKIMTVLRSNEIFMSNLRIILKNNEINIFH